MSTENLQKPVGYWIKEDRLLNEVGKELTIILRTKGCSWALGETGGCSMCGYIQDATTENINPEYIIAQFDTALQSKLEDIENDKFNYIIKIFNSGSFFDEKEISQKVRNHIYEEISKIKRIKEVVVESRVEYITPTLLTELNDSLKDKYTEIAIGLETVNDYFRNNYINKGLTFENFKKAVDLCKQEEIGIKTYLLFKPPFINEQGAVDDCIASMKEIINMGVNSISINPMNIQKGTLVEYLWFQKRYRTPWFYSLFKAIKRTLSKQETKIRILSDPSGAGTIRGIHNCLDKECNQHMIQILKEFVLTQNTEALNLKQHTCECKKIYYLQRYFH